MSYAHYRIQLETLVGTPPIFDATKPLDPQVHQWLAWSERVKMLQRFEHAQALADQRAKARSGDGDNRAPVKR